MNIYITYHSLISISSISLAKTNVYLFKSKRFVFFAIFIWGKVSIIPLDKEIYLL